MQASHELVSWVISSLLLSLRIAPVFALAPPFSLTTVPVAVRVLFGVGVAACLISAHPADGLISDFGLGNLMVCGLRELLLGTVFLMAFQLTFGALYMAGRTIDIQAGFGLATLIDPATAAQTPLIGTVYAFTAAAGFFSLGGQYELLHIASGSLDAIPIGAARLPGNLEHLTGFIGLVMSLSLGVAGGAILALFLADLSIAMLARTMPQMNVLILGFQVKTLLLLLVLPLTFGAFSALTLRLMSAMLQALPSLT